MPLVVGPAHLGRVTPHRPAERARTRVETDGPSAVTLRSRQPCANLEVDDESRPVARLQLERDALRDQAPGRLRVLRFEHHYRKSRERVRDPPRVVEGAVEGEALLE